MGENKIEKSNKKLLIGLGLISLVVVIALLVSIGIGLRYLLKSDEHIDVDNQVKMTTSQEKDEDEIKNQPEEKEKKKKITLVALDNTSYGVKADSAFRLESDEELSKEMIEKSLIVEPENTFTIEEVSNKEYTIQFNKALHSSSVIKFTYNQDDHEYGWAFQTERVFAIEGTTPADPWEYAPVETGIEIYFTKKADQKIDDYFQIEPHVNGNFEYKGNKVIFIPNGELKKDTTYKVTINKDYGNGEETIGEDYVFSFRTVPYYNGLEFNFKEINTLFHVDGPQGIQLYIRSRKKSESKAEVGIYGLKDEAAYISALMSIHENGLSVNPFDDITNNISYSEEVRFEGDIIKNEDDYYGGSYVELPEKLEEGYYLLEVSIEDTILYKMVQVSKYNAYVAMDSDQVLVWAVDVEAGKPYEGGKVAFNQEEKGMTDKDGIFSYDLQGEEEADLYITLYDDEGHSLVADLTEYDHIWYNYWDYDWSWEWEDGDIDEDHKNYWTYLYTDREIYRPDDKVQVFGLVKKRKDKNIDEVKVTIEYNDKILQEQVVTLSEIGTYTCDFTVENYQYYGCEICIYIGEKRIDRDFIEFGDITIPSYKLEVEKNKDYLMVGDSIKLETLAGYYEGTPLPDAKIQVRANNFKIENMNSVESTTIYSDENGVGQIEIFPEVDTKEWRPSYKSIRLQCDEFQEYYSSSYQSFIFYPKNMMVRLDYDKLSDSQVNVNVNMNDINLEHYSGTIYDYNSVIGKAAAGKAFTMTIEEEYTEAYVEDTRYDAINKVSYDITKYRTIRNTLKTIEGVTDAKGRYQVDFNEIKEGRRYYFTVDTSDWNGSEIQEELYYSNKFSSFVAYIHDISLMSVETDKREYRKNESIQTFLTYGKGEIQDTEENFALFMLCQDGIKEIKVEEDLATSFTFNTDLIPNAYLGGVYFDGVHLFVPIDQSISYERDEMQLNVDLQTDKKEYKPGDTVLLDIGLTDENGQGIQGDVNINVVDEALLSIYPNHTDILYEVYGWTYDKGIKREKMITSIKSQDWQRVMAEGGDGGGDTYIREDFELTAHFTTIKTDENGKATYSFVLPDNLTSWNIHALGLSDQLHAGQNDININAKLPLFIHTILADTYMKNDELAPTIRVVGTEVSKDTDIDFDLSLEKDGKLINTVMFSGKGQEFLSPSLGKLETGEYTVTIIGKADGFSDGKKEVIQVVDCMQYVEVLKEQALSENISLIAHDNPISLAFVNKAAADHYQQLGSIYRGKNGRRIELLAAAFTAGNTMNEMYGSEVSTDFIDVYKKYIHGSLFSELTYGNQRAESTAYVLLSDVYRKGVLSKEVELEMKEELYRQVKNNYSSFNTDCAALLSLGIMNEPVLLDVYRALESEEISDKEIKIEQTYLLLALIELGDLEKAESLYNEWMIGFSVLEKAEDTIQIQGEFSRKNTALMMLAGTKLGHMEEAKKMYNHLKTGIDEEYITAIEKINYLKALEGIWPECTFTYELNGKTTEVNLTHNENTYLTLLPEEAQTFKIKEIKGEGIVFSKSIGRVEELEPTDELQVSRTYKVNGKEVSSTNLKQGDVVVISIEINKDEKSQVNRVCIDDVLPSCLVFKNVDKDNGRRYYYSDVKGNDVKLYTSFGSSNKISVSYNAIAVNKGTFTAEAVVVQNVYGVEVNYDEKKIISVH